MEQSAAFIFYDTETTGTDTRFDQIFPFAAIKADDGLNPIETFNIHVGHYLFDPMF